MVKQRKADAGQCQPRQAELRMDTLTARPDAALGHGIVLQPMPLLETIFHIAEKADWEQALQTGDYRAPSLEGEGFIHCSSAHQVVETANRFFAGRRDLMLLEIDASGLSSVVFEAPSPPRGELDTSAISHGPVTDPFPHVYGPVPVDRVRSVFEFESDELGRFSLPAAIRD